MKKRFVIIVLTLFLLFSSITTFTKVRAEELELEPVITEEEKENVLDSVKGFLSNYMDANLVAQIVTWCGYALEGIALIAVAIKYGKFKNGVAKEVIDAVKKENGSAVKEELVKQKDDFAKLADSLKEVKLANETIMKVLVLMQDNSTKGKSALIDFLGSKTESKEIKETVEVVNAKLEEQAKVEEEVLEQVSKDYEEIF